MCRADLRLVPTPIRVPESRPVEGNTAVGERPAFRCLTANAVRLSGRWFCLTGVRRGCDVDTEGAEKGPDERKIEPSSSSAEIGRGLGPRGFGDAGL